MSENPKEILSEEYSRRLNNVCLRLLKFVGYLRYEIKDSHFIEKLPSTIIRSVIMINLVIVSAAYILFVLDYQAKYLSVTETITVVCLTLVQNATQINITFYNRNSGLQLMNTSIEIDVILGYKETKFMRDIAALTFVFLSIFMGVFLIAVFIVIYAAHPLSTLIYIIGTFYFFMVFSIFFDACFLVAFYNFLSLRLHYINIALLKYAKVNPTYFANQLLFNGILWKKSFDKIVTFHNRAEPTEFIQVFDIIFEQLRQLEKYFRFTIFVSQASLIFGTFVGVQTIFVHKQLPNIHILRTIAVIGWVGVGWIYLLILSQHIDVFYRQIEKTKLICNYIQLKPVMPIKVLKLTKRVLRMLEVHEPRVSIYNMYYFNTNHVLQIAASIFVYITVQLQISAPTSRPSEFVTNSTDESHRNMFLFR